MFLIFFQDKGFDYWDDDEFANELEMFTTPIDDNPYIDEFITFKDTFQGKFILIFSKPYTHF